MMQGDRRRKLAMLLIGLFFLFAPLLILVATLEALILFGEVDFADLSLVELVELYVLDLVLLGLFAFVVYRLARHFLETELPGLRDELGRNGETDEEE